MQRGEKVMSGKIDVDDVRKKNSEEQRSQATQGLEMLKLKRAELQQAREVPAIQGPLQCVLGSNARAATSSQDSRQSQLRILWNVRGSQHPSLP